MPDTSFADRMKVHGRDWFAARGYSQDIFEERWSWVLSTAARANNLFHADWWRFIAGKEHKWARSLNSSQCFAVNVFAPLALDNRLAVKVLKDLAPDLGVADDDAAEVAFEATPTGATQWLGESARQPTQVDVLFIVRRAGQVIGCMPVEVKFTESGIGVCRAAFEMSGEGDQVVPRPECLHFGGLRENAASLCAMSRQFGRKYWDIMLSPRGPFDLAGLDRNASCPFRHGLYQLMRNQVLAVALAEHLGAQWARLGVCFHPGNNLVADVPEAVGGLRDARDAFDLLVPKHPIVRLSPERIVGAVLSADGTWRSWAEWVVGRYALAPQVLGERTAAGGETAVATRSAETRAALLAESARALLAQPPKPAGFWARVKTALSGPPTGPKPTVRPGTAERGTRIEDFVAADFEPFCRMENVTLLLRSVGPDIEYALFDGEEQTPDVPLVDEDMKPLPPGPALLALMHAVAFQEDSEIDAEESPVLVALERVFRLNSAEVRQARRAAFIGILTTEFSGFLVQPQSRQRVASVRAALGFTDWEACKLSRAAAVILFGHLLRSDRVDVDIVAQVHAVLLELGVSRKEVEEHLRVLEVAAYLGELSAGKVVAAADLPITLRTGEKGYTATSVAVFQQETVTRTRRGYIGTRVKIGRLPIYLGASEPMHSTSEVVAKVGDGTLVVTNQRVAVVGTKLNYSIKLESVLDVDRLSDAVQIHAEGKHGGRYYKVADPMRLFILLQFLRGKLAE